MHFDHERTLARHESRAECLRRLFVYDLRGEALLDEDRHRERDQHGQAERLA
jgi:hypothetical protein